MFKKKTQQLGFSVKIIVHEIWNVPYSNGSFFCEIKCPSGSSPKKFASSSQDVAEFHVAWEEEFEYTLKLSKANDTFLLNEAEMRINVYKENVGGTKSHKIGHAKVNLSQFAGKRESVKNFLLFEAKTNTSIRVTICMNQISGDTIFKVPGLSERITSVHVAAGEQELRRTDSMTELGQDLLVKLNPRGVPDPRYRLTKTPTIQEEQRITSQYLHSLVRSTRRDEEEVVRDILNLEMAEGMEITNEETGEKQKFYFMDHYVK